MTLLLATLSGAAGGACLAARYRQRRGWRSGEISNLLEAEQRYEKHARQKHGA